MSVTPQTNPITPPEPAYPEWTQADQDAMFASVAWVHQQREAGQLAPYQGLYVAVLGKQIIDSDRDEPELARRLEALGDSLPPNRVVIQYVPRPEDWIW